MNNLALNSPLLPGYNGIPLNLQQSGYSSSSGWGTGPSLLGTNSSSQFGNTAAINPVSINSFNSSYYGTGNMAAITNTEIGNFLGFLTQIVGMVASLLLQFSANKPANAPNANSSSASDMPQDTVTPPPSNSGSSSELDKSKTPAASQTGAPATQVPPCPAPGPAAAFPPPAGNTDNLQTGSVNGGGPNELVLKNTDSKAMTIALFENTGPGMNPNIDDPNNKFTIQPGQTLKLSMPASWQGRAQKLGGNASDPATWAEINYEPGQNGGANKIWYDESTIRGYNSAVTMKPTHSSDAGCGIDKSIIDGAPADAVTTDAGGNKVIKATEGYDGSVNQSSQDYLDSSIGNTNAYVRHYDDGAVRTTQDNSLTVTFGAA